MLRKKLTEEGYAPPIQVMNISRVEAIVDRNGIKPPRIMRSAALSWTQSSGGFLSKVSGHSCDCAETPSVGGTPRKTLFNSKCTDGLREL